MAIATSNFMIGVTAASSVLVYFLFQWILGGGLVASMLLVATGLLAALITGDHRGNADRVITIGLVVLALTPVVRVVALVATWIGEHDRRFVALSLIVAMILAGSILSAL